MPLFSIERKEAPALCRGESVSPFSIESRQKRECLSLLDREERDSFSLQRRESASSLERGGRLLSLYRRGSVSLVYREERETPSLCRGESVSLSIIEMRQTPFSLQKRECLSLSFRRTGSTTMSYSLKSWL